MHLLPPLYYIKKSNILHKIDATVQRDDHKSLGKEVLEASPYKGSITNYVFGSNLLILYPFLSNLEIKVFGLNVRLESEVGRKT